MKQRCPLVLVHLTWLVYLAGLVYLPMRGETLAAGIWLVGLPVFMLLYVRTFPRTSRFFGYGRVDDKPAENVWSAPVKVTFYGAMGCPFCPIVSRRLHALQERMGFTLEHVDLTTKPGLLARKGIRSVPVVEVGDRRLVGNATSEQLAELISGAKSA